MQEIFLDLWKSAGRYDASIGSETTFIAMIARRRLVDRRRQRARTPETEPLSERGEVGKRESASSGSVPPEMGAEAALAARALYELRRTRLQVLNIVT